MQIPSDPPAQNDGAFPLQTGDGSIWIRKTISFERIGLTKGLADWQFEAKRLQLHL